MLSAGWRNQRGTYGFSSFRFRSSELPCAHLTHPTSPESSARAKAEREEAVRKLLENWNGGLEALKPAITHPDMNIALKRYRTKFAESDLPDIRLEDLPAGET